VLVGHQQKKKIVLETEKNPQFDQSTGKIGKSGQEGPNSKRAKIRLVHKILTYRSKKAWKSETTPKKECAVLTPFGCTEKKPPV
jgi:hypothetical protein